MSTLDNPHGLHIDVDGSGPPLVLLHGWAMHGGVFAPLVERLQEILRTSDADAATTEVTGLAADHPLFPAVRDAIAARKAQL